MMEKGSHFNIIIYNRKDIDLKSKLVEWKPLRKFINLSSDISEFSVFNYLYSPNLKLFIDSNNSGDSFIIKRTLDNSILLTLPVGVTRPEFDRPADLVKKFKWISNDRFKFVNFEGMEKIYEIQKDSTLSEIGHGRVPMLDQNEISNCDTINFYDD